MTAHSTIVIRQVAASDVIAVAKACGHRSPEVLQGWKTKVGTGHAIMFAAYDGDQVVGSVNILLDGADEPPVITEIGTTPMINALGINASHRGQGIGEQLLRTCEKYMIDHPELPQLLALGVEPDNEIAVKLYEKVGYRTRAVGGALLFESSWPEFDEHGQRYIFKTLCRLMIKTL